MTHKADILDVDELRSAFADAVGELDNETNNAVIENLSRALAALQAAGLDVSFEVTGWVGHDTFKPIAGKGGTATFSGFLNIGNNRHILSLLVQPDKTVLAISYFNATLGIGSDGRMWAYDITSPDCYSALQKQIVTLAARNAYLDAHDVANAFSAGQTQNGARKVTLMKPQRTP